MPRSVGSPRGVWSVLSSVLSPATVAIDAEKRACAQPLPGDRADDLPRLLWRDATPHGSNGSRGSARPPHGCATRRNTSQPETPRTRTCAGYGRGERPTARRYRHKTYGVHIRRDLSGSGLLTIVCKRFLIRELEDRFESQSRASRSGIALGVSPSGVSPQVVDHRLESATIPRPIAIAKGAKQLREGVGGGH